MPKVPGPLRGRPGIFGFNFRGASTLPIWAAERAGSASWGSESVPHALDSMVHLAPRGMRLIQGRTTVTRALAPALRPAFPACLPVALVSPSARCREQGEVKISSQRGFQVHQSLVVHWDGGSSEK